MSKLKIKLVSDYILLRPDKPTLGKRFTVDNVINETATVEAAGPKVSKETKELVGKRVIYNAWACDEKTIEGDKVYLATESANAICATI